MIILTFALLFQWSMGATINAKTIRDSMHTDHTQCYKAHLDPNDPNSLAYYRALSDHLDEIGAPHPGLGHLERISAGSIPWGGTAPVNGESKDIYLMRISALFSFLEKMDDKSTGEPYFTTHGFEKIGYATSAASLLAAHHFNTGDGSVIGEVEGINNKCPVRITVDFYDIEYSKRTAVDVLTSQILHNAGRRTPTTAIFGGLYSFTSIQLAALTGSYGVPQVCPTCTSTELDDADQYPLFGRILPSDAGTARAIVSFAYQRNSKANDEELRFIGVLYKNDAFGTAYYLALKESEYFGVYSKEGGVSQKDDSGGGDDQIIHVKGAHFNTPEGIDTAVQVLAKKGFRVFVGIFYTKDYEQVMESAYKYGIAGPGYVWILTDGVGPEYLNGRSFPAGSPLAIASQGLGMIMAHGGMRSKAGDSGYDRIIRSLTKETSKTVDYVNCVGHPKSNSLNASIYYQARNSFLRDLGLIPPELVFYYDSIIAFGLAACDLHTPISPISDGKNLMEAFLQKELVGASGFISIDPKTHSRRPGSAVFAAYNAQGITDGNTTSFTMDIVCLTVPANNTNSTDITWVDAPGKKFYYSDNTTVFPYPLPQIANFDKNFIIPAARIVFLSFASAIFALSLFFLGWTFHHRKERVITASQPMFLYMICIGTFLMGGTIVTLSIDDSIASEQYCSVACMLSPWFLATGFVFAFSALFAKEWRINKIMNNPAMRRVKVARRDVIVPFVLLLGMNVLVLSLWTGLSPLVWNRFVVGNTDKYDRYVESVGKCTGEQKHWAPYVGILLFINMAMVGLASFQAYRARLISVEFSESKWIGIILVTILQAVAIGIPLIALAQGNPTINFVVEAGLVSILCITFLVAMFVPKFFYLKDARVEAAKKKERLREAADRRAAYLQRLNTDETEARGTEDSSSNPESSVGVKVVFHPKRNSKELGELEALKDEEMELRRKTCVEVRNDDAKKRGYDGYVI
eukprot:CAMPEP_0172578104 /NCGR_PEP_ID=MMETSP1067-20121228/138569_1 /TAXON_ID=265564 ORGANISM="Thalassiosira punctigera, Strain Tpunct2005C2" /NCGR_SAMPLE_ID=MMETSP1067 /ASSEMBLY_ACC=CAM_ASM_000444 /LENGTH=972 /DNA_ID=CAMNT_0013370797 /DNA_START=307 /DNA_END=3225 /DNA_ORIENTATION=-